MAVDGGLGLDTIEIIAACPRVSFMVQTPIEPQLLYPDSDGKPMAEWRALQRSRYAVWRTRSSSFRAEPGPAGTRPSVC